MKICADAVWTGGLKTKRVVSASTNDSVSDNRLLEILDCTVRRLRRPPHYIYAQIIFEAALGLLHAATSSRQTPKTNEESRFLVDVIRRSFLIASIAMHFHGSVTLPGAICLEV